MSTNCKDKVNKDGEPQRKAFLGLLWGQATSSIGNQLHLIVVSWLIFQATGSAQETAGVFIAQMLPSLLFGWWLGAGIDRYNLFRMMLFLDVFRLVLVGGMLFLLYAQSSSLWAIYGIIFLMACASVLFNGCEKTVVSRLFSEEERVDAHGRLEMARQIGVVLGPVMAAWATFFLSPPSNALILDMLTFVLSIVSLVYAHQQCKSWQYVVVSTEEEEEGSESYWDEVKRSLAFMIREPFIRATLVVFGGSNWILWALFALFPVLDQAFEMEGKGYGYLFSVLGLGMLFGSLQADRVCHWLGDYKTLVGGLLLVTLSLGTLVLAKTFWLPLLCIAVLGFSVAPANALTMSLLQKLTPEKMHGSVMTTWLAMMELLGPLGLAFWSYWLEKQGWEKSVMGMALCMVFFTLLGGYFFRLPVAEGEIE